MGKGAGMAAEHTPIPEGERRRCPWCGSENTKLMQRGFTGPTDERDQYFICRDCEMLTFEIVSKTARDMRLGQYRLGATYRDNPRQTRYRISRVLKVGVNEHLLYLKPIVRQEQPAAERSARR